MKCAGPQNICPLKYFLLVIQVSTPGQLYFIKTEFSSTWVGETTDNRHNIKAKTDCNLRMYLQTIIRKFPMIILQIFQSVYKQNNKIQFKFTYHLF